LMIASGTSDSEQLEPVNLEAACSTCSKSQRMVTSRQINRG
jgi:hypothetical protein